VPPASRVSQRREIALLFSKRRWPGVAALIVVTPMNPIAIIHAIVALVAIGTAVPLIKRKIKMNPWYGVRIPEAFKSEERWFEINQYGGRLLLWWGISIAVIAGIGLPLAKKYWILYSFSALGIILGGLGIVTIRIFRYAAKTKKR
jgi:uncharacterized membrane protein